MLLAKQEGDAIQLLTNREWITNKLKICGPADVINDFLELFTFVKEDEVVIYHIINIELIFYAVTEFH